MVRDQLRVLLVEDDAALAAMYRAQLEIDGYSVRVAGNAEQGLRSAIDFQPDIVCLDRQLPGLDGIDLLEALRADPRTSLVAAFMLSGDDGAEVRERSRQLGALDYLLKSRTTPADLSRRISGWLAQAPPAARRPAGEPVVSTGTGGEGWKVLVRRHIARALIGTPAQHPVSGELQAMLIQLEQEVASLEEATARLKILQSEASYPEKADEQTQAG